MPYGYLGQNTPNQTINNSGVFSITDVAELKSQGKLGGSLELIAEETYSSAVSFVDFKDSDGTFDTSYNVHFMTLNNIGMSTANFNQPAFRFYESGTLESAGVYHLARQNGFFNGTSSESKSTSDTGIAGLVDNNVDTTRSRNLYAYFYNLSDNSKYSFSTFQGVSIRSNTEVRYSFGGGVLPQASTVDGIRVYPKSGGNFSSFNIKLYGVKQI